MGLRQKLQSNAASKNEDNNEYYQTNKAEGKSKSSCRTSVTETETKSDAIVDVSHLQPELEYTAMTETKSVTPTLQKVIPLFSNAIGRPSGQDK